MDKLLPLIPAVCIFGLLGFLVFIFALCKTAAISDDMMDKIIAAYEDGDGDYLGG
jgi:hypothetical protein